jgi:hypothetical protein
MKRTTLTILLAAALGAGSAIAQTSQMSPGEERTPSAASPAGDTRVIPGDDTRTAPPYRADRSPSTTATPAQPVYRSDTNRSWRDRWYAWRDRWFSPRADLRESRDSSYSAGSPLGSEQYRFDGPDQGRFVNPSQG